MRLSAAIAPRRWDDEMLEGKKDGRLPCKPLRATLARAHLLNDIALLAPPFPPYLQLSIPLPLRLALPLGLGAMTGPLNYPRRLIDHATWIVQRN